MMNQIETHAWKFAASCSGEEMFGMICRILQDQALRPHPQAECRLVLPSGNSVPWPAGEDLRAGVAILATAVRSSRAQASFCYEVSSPDGLLRWDFVLNRTALPFVSCGLEGDETEVPRPARPFAEQALLTQLSQGYWSFLFQGQAREWVGDPVWIYLKHKCDRVRKVRDGMLKCRTVADETQLSAALNLHALLVTCLEQASIRGPVGRVAHGRLGSFLAELDALLARSAPPGALDVALRPLGVGLAEWLAED